MLHDIIIKGIALLSTAGLFYFIITLVLRRAKKKKKTEAYLELEKLMSKNEEEGDKIIREARNEASKLSNSELIDRAVNGVQSNKDKAKD